jgi:cytochrome P450
LQDLSKQIDAIKSEVKRGMKPNKLTIFHELLSHDLPPEEVAPRRLRDEAQTVVGAGLTTTSWSLTHACFYLAENETLQAKLHAELMDAIPDIHAEDAFSFQKLEGLPYLRGCVREGIRLATGVSGRNARILESPLRYRDWVIPPGTSISMNTQDISFDEDIFPNPGELVPERWSGNPQAPDGSSLERYFVPFGKGDRQCLGIK